VAQNTKPFQWNLVQGRRGQRLSIEFEYTKIIRLLSVVIKYSMSDLISYVINDGS